MEVNEFLTTFEYAELQKFKFWNPKSFIISRVKTGHEFNCLITKYHDNFILLNKAQIYND